MVVAALMLVAIPIQTTLATETAEKNDTIESVAEDTTFFYENSDEDMVENADSDAVAMDDEAWEEYAQEFKKTFFTDDLPWWGKGLLLCFTALLLAFLFLIFTAPLWILALIIWLVYRSTRKREDSRQAAAKSGQPVPPSIFDAPKGTDADLWRSGMNQAAWAVGLLIAAWLISSRLVAAIGLLLACLAASKFYLAKREQGQHHQQAQQATQPNDDAPESEADKDNDNKGNYNKTE